MTFAQAFKLSSYALIASGFVAISATGTIDTLSIVLFSTLFIASWFLDTTMIRERIPGWALNILGILYLPFFMLDYRLLSRSLMLAIAHLLLFTAAVKLVTLSKDRDYILLYLISLADLLAASTLTVNILFIACFIVFLLSGISTLILFEMRRTNARIQNEMSVQPLFVPRQFQGTGMELFSTFPAGLLSAMVCGITGLILVVSIPIFFLLPRITSGMYGKPSGNMQYTTGFSEQVELGQIGNLKKSDAVVMRVKMDRDPDAIPGSLKWRGLAFDYYDGRAWKRTDRSRNSIPVQSHHYKLENSTQGTDWINQTFFLEALSTDVIFTTHKALAVSQDVGILQRDFSGNLYAPRAPYKKLRYSVVSDPIRPDPANLSDLRPIPEEILKTYTQVPLEDPRVKALALEITKSSRDKYAKALTLQQYLKTHYAYSLVLRGKPNNRDPLAVFLFDVRSGHCEYFASAMAIMLRQLGIPSRLVNGFQTGEYNRLGNSWTVRQYHAHSWVEAYFPPYGWIEFDPTPPDTGNAKGSLSLLLSNISDAIDLWWWEGVVNYDFPKQAVVLRNLRLKLDKWLHGLGKVSNSIQRAIQNRLHEVTAGSLAVSFMGAWMLWIPALALIALLASAAVRIRLSGRLQRAIHSRNTKFIATSFYLEALGVLSTKGMRRSKGQTPMEFAGSIAKHPAGKPFLSLTKIYNAIRFGPPNTSFRRSEADALLRELRSALKKE